jgi:hypothetical protein
LRFCDLILFQFTIYSAKWPTHLPGSTLLSLNPLWPLGALLNYLNYLPRFMSTLPLRGR